MTCCAGGFPWRRQGAKEERSRHGRAKGVGVSGAIYGQHGHAHGSWMQVLGGSLRVLVNIMWVHVCMGRVVNMQGLDEHIRCRKNKQRSARVSFVEVIWDGWDGCSR